MDGSAVTFDFHNTLATCPEWFELEVRRLPSAFLRWWTAARPESVAGDRCDEADGLYRELRREIMDHGNELPAEACLAAVFQKMQLDIPQPDIAWGIEHLMRRTLTAAKPVPGAVSVVRAIEDNGVPIGVVSSAVYHPFLEWTLEAFGIRQSVRAIVTSASAGFYKSRPEIYWHAAEMLGTRPERMVHVGDSLRYDVSGAQRAGLRAVWLQRDRNSPNDYQISPDLTLETLEAAAPRILTLLRGEASTEGAAGV